MIEAADHLRLSVIELAPVDILSVDLIVILLWFHPGPALICLAVVGIVVVCGCWCVLSLPSRLSWLVLAWSLIKWTGGEAAGVALVLPSFVVQATV